MIQEFKFPPSITSEQRNQFCDQLPPGSTMSWRPPPARSSTALGSIISGTTMSSSCSADVTYDKSPAPQINPNYTHIKTNHMPCQPCKKLFSSNNSVVPLYTEMPRCCTLPFRPSGFGSSSCVQSYRQKQSTTAQYSAVLPSLPEACLPQFYKKKTMVVRAHLLWRVCVPGEAATPNPNPIPGPNRNPYTS